MIPRRQVPWRIAHDNIFNSIPEPRIARVYIYSKQRLSDRYIVDSVLAKERFVRLSSPAPPVHVRRGFCIPYTAWGFHLFIRWWIFEYFDVGPNRYEPIHMAENAIHGLVFTSKGDACYGSSIAFLHIMHRGPRDAISLLLCEILNLQQLTNSPSCDHIALEQKNRRN